MILSGRCVDDYNDPNCIFYARLVTPRLRGRNEVQGRWTRWIVDPNEVGVSNTNVPVVDILQLVILRKFTRTLVVSVDHVSVSEV